MTLGYCPLFSSSSGNAGVVFSENTRILVDAGKPGRAITDALKETGIAPESINGIVVTHEHTDHTKGVGIMSRKFGIPVYANAPTWEAMEYTVGEIKLANTRVFETGEDFYIGDINVLPYAVSHDAAEPVGYSFTHGGRTMAQLTDTGCVTKQMFGFIENAELLLIESNHDVDMLKNGRYPMQLKRRILGSHGHLSNVTAGNLCAMLCQTKKRRFILGHLSPENNTEEIAMRTVSQLLYDSGIDDAELYIAKKDRPTAIFGID